MAWSISGVAADVVPGVSPDLTTAYFLSDAHVVSAINIATGQLAWTARTDSIAATTFGWSIGATSSTAVVGDLDVYGFDQQTGARLWKFARETGDEGIRAMAVEGQRVLLAGRDGIVTALNARDGATLWQASVNRPDTNVLLFHPSIANGVALVAGRWDVSGSSRGALFAFDISSGQKLWEHRFSPELPGQSSDCYGPAVLASGSVVVSQADGRIFALDPRDGEVRWTSPRVHNPVTEGLNDVRYVATDGRDILATSSTATIALIDGVTGEERWHIRDQFGSPLRPGALGADAAYVAHNGNLVAYSRNDGHVVWRRNGTTNKWYQAGPTLARNDLALVTRTDAFLGVLTKQ